MTQVYAALENLKKYKQAEKDGLLLRLPCEVGSTVWVSPNNGKSFHSGKLYGKNKKGSHLVFVDDADRNCVEHPLERPFYDWFIEVYTSEEAEAGRNGGRA